MADAYKIKPMDREVIGDAEAIDRYHAYEKEWMNDRDQKLKEAFQSGRQPFISDNSMLRPSNLRLRYEMNQLPEQVRPSWQHLADEYEKRLNRNNAVHDELQANPDALQGLQYQPIPWTMMMEKPYKKPNE